MADPRKPVFDAIRAQMGVIRIDWVVIIDDALDQIGFPRAESEHRKINAAGLALIKEFEGLRLKAYRDPVGVLTIGYGSTGPHVRPGMTITEAEADALLQRDLERFEKVVAEMDPKATDNQFAALVSFAFNLGTDALRRSTLLKLHIQGDYRGAKAEFARWKYAGGKVLPGLVRRRAAEAELYATP